jgi:ribosomal protein L37AE/L43A
LTRRKLKTTQREYLKIYGLPQSCPACSSHAVAFNFGIYKCNKCGYREDWRGNERIEKIREKIAGGRSLIRVLEGADEPQGPSLESFGVNEK